MKHSLSFSLALLCFLAGFSQVSLAPEVLASGSQYAHQGGLHVSYTIGEMTSVTTAGNLNGLHLTQGFHQPEEVNVLSTLNDQKAEDINFALFPNPTSQSICIGYHMPEPGTVNLSLYSLGGQLIQNLVTEAYSGGSSLHHYDVSRLSPGNYLLSVQFTNSAGQQCLSSKQFSVTH